MEDKKSKGKYYENGTNENIHNLNSYGKNEVTRLNF
jgi:hypothetical protein